MQKLELDCLVKKFNTGGEIFKRCKPEEMPLLRRKLKSLDTAVEPPVYGETEPVKILDKYKRIVVAAPQGMGKTTLLNYLAVTLYREFLPIPATFRQWAKENIRKDQSCDVLMDEASRLFSDLSVNTLEKRLETGKCLLLLDGADEVTGCEDRTVIMTQIRSVVEKYPQIPVVMTCRDFRYCQEIPGFTRFSLLPLERKQVEEFLVSWFAESDPARGESLIRRIRIERDLQEMAGNPLMLSVIASIWGRRENAKATLARVAVYNRLMDIYLEEWEVQKNIRSRFSLEQKRSILAKLAYKVHSNHRRSMTEREIMEVFDLYTAEAGLNRSDSDLILKEMCQRNGVLAKVGPAVYEFSLLGFQEYFTALELSSGNGDMKTLLSHLAEPNWRGIILFYAGLTGDASALIRHIVENDDDDIFFNRLMLAGCCLAEAKTVNPKLRERIIRQLWDIYLLGDYPLLRENAAEVLSRLKPPHVIKELLDQLTDNDDGVRRAAAQTLGLIGGPEVLPPLIMLFVKENEVRIRCDAAAALGHIAGHEAIGPLLDALERDESHEIRRCAAAALGATGSVEALATLLKTLRLDEDYRVRASAAEALGELKHRDAVPQLVKSLKLEERQSVRWRIVMALGKIGGNEAREILIRTLTEDNDRDVRNSAAEALGFIAGEESVKCLIKAVQSDDEPEVRGFSAFSLGQIGSEEAMPVLIEALITDESLEVRGRAAFALGRIKKMDALPYLTAVFNSYQDSFIRGNATYAVGEIAGAEAIPFLIQALLLDKDPYVRFRAADVLGDVGNTLTIPHLQTALKDTGMYFGWKISDKAFEALDKISHRFQVIIYRGNPEQTPPHPQLEEE